MKIKIGLLIVVLSLVSCANPKPRKPIAHTGRMDMDKSIAYNKKLFELEKKAFQSIINKDTLHQYIDSKHGFWYAYDVEMSTDSIRPTKGDEVVFAYDVKALDGQIIYTQQELGDKTYRVDQQDFMQGIQEGIKLMKVDEKVIFLLPSQKAYSYYGDENKIGTNMPLIVSVELKEIR